MLGRPLIAAAAVGLCVAFAITCKVVKEDPQTQTTVDDLCLTANDILGWVPTGSACEALSIDLLYRGAEGSINGGADEYRDRGLVEWAYQTLETAEGKTVEIYVMDQGTADKATEVYEYKKATVTSKVVLNNYAESTAVMDFTGGETVYQTYAHLGEFHFEMGFEGMANREEAIAMAELFLDIFDSKM